MGFEPGLFELSLVVELLLLLLLDLGDLPLNLVQISLELQHRVVLPMALGHAQLAAQDQLPLLLALYQLPLAYALLKYVHWDRWFCFEKDCSVP